MKMSFCVPWFSEHKPQKTALTTIDSSFSVVLAGVWRVSSPQDSMICQKHFIVDEQFRNCILTKRMVKQSLTYLLNGRRRRLPGASPSWQRIGPLSLVILTHTPGPTRREGTSTAEFTGPQYGQIKALLTRTQASGCQVPIVLSSIPFL